MDKNCLKFSESLKCVPCFQLRSLYPYVSQNFNPQLIHTSPTKSYYINPHKQYILLYYIIIYIYICSQTPLYNASPQKMSSQSDPLSNKDLPTATFRWTLRGRRRRLPTVRLGGNKPRRGFLLGRVCRKAKLKWVKAKYLCMVKKVKEYYKDVVEGPGTIESFHQRMLLETSFAIPVMGLTFIN